MSAFRDDFERGYIFLACATGCLDAPNAIPAGGMRSGQVLSPWDFYKWMAWPMTVPREVAA